MLIANNIKQDSPQSTNPEPNSGHGGTVVTETVIIFGKNT